MLKKALRFALNGSKINGVIQLNEPLYEKIYKTIRDDISNGKYGIECTLPSETVIASVFHTTRVTVRNALTRLASEGYIYSVAGKGYFVKNKKFDKYLFEFDEKKILNSNIEKSKLISVEIIKPDVELSYNLRLPGNRRIVAIKKILYVADKKVAYDEKYIPYFSGMPIIESEINVTALHEMVSNKEPLYSMKKKLVINVVQSNEDIMKIFDFSQPQPVFKVEQTILDEDNEPIAWSKLTYLMDYFKIEARLLLNK
jgi:GntR family transcriptional regulator